MRISSFLAALAAAVVMPLSAAPNDLPQGFGVDVTRIVIENGRQSGSCVLTNGSDVPYAAKNTALDYFTRERRSDVIATPPVALMPTGKQVRVTVTVLDPEALPKDRESLFLLSSEATPGVGDQSSKNTLLIRYASRLKVFYRPEGVDANMQDAIWGLAWTRDGNTLTVENGSPLHVTLANVSIEGKRYAEHLIVKPFERTSLTVGEHPADATVRWDGVDDYGGVVTGRVVPAAP